MGVMLLGGKMVSELEPKRVNYLVFFNLPGRSGFFKPAKSSLIVDPTLPLLSIASCLIDERGGGEFGVWNIFFKWLLLFLLDSFFVLAYGNIFTC
jgi:hypothetical protein